MTSAIVPLLSKLLPLGADRDPRRHFEYKMLLIGETGSGKTSFLNLLCNCNLISVLGLTDYGGDALSQFTMFNDVALERHEDLEISMRSNTSAVRLYNVNVGDIQVGIIDTPGFGDTSGLKADEKNTEATVRYLDEQVKFISCVCLVVNGRQSRMNTNLKLVLTQITSILPRTVLNNLVIVFTNTANVLDLNFDPAEFDDFLGAKIGKCRQFCVENPYCKFEKVKRMQDHLSIDEIASNMQSSFKETTIVLAKMCEVMRDFKPVPTDYFTRLYEKRQQIEKNVLRILAEYDNSNNLEENTAVAKRNVEEALTNKMINKDFTISYEYVKIHADVTDLHNTVCGICCSNCHVPCQLESVFRFPKVKKCRIFGLKESNHCTECGHEASHHYHSKTMFRKVTEIREVIVDAMKRNFDSAETNEERARMLLEALEEDRKRLQHKREMLSQELLQALDDFSQLGVSRSFKKLLESQISVIEERIEFIDSDASEHKTRYLRETLKKLQEKLKIVTDALKRPWSPDTNPHFQRNWARKIFGFDPSEQLTDKKIDKTFKTLSNCEHPDKGGDHEYYQRIIRARDILKGQTRTYY